MAIPLLPLITALSPFVSRLFDKDKIVSKTNITTVAGGGLIATAYMLIQQPDQASQMIGWSLGIVGAAITLFKENKDKI